MWTWQRASLVFSFDTPIHTHATTTLDLSKPHQVVADPFSFYLLVNVIDIF